MNSPIKYFGGKGGGLGRDILDYFPDRSSYDIFLEPFGGGASVLFLKEPSGSEIYNDLEENVYSFFKVLSNRSLFSKFKDKCDLAIYSRQLRDEYIEDLKRGNLDIVERAYKYFYINRTSVNGAGGFSITVNYIRRNMSKSISDFLSSIDGLKAAHDRVSKWIVERTDGIDLIKKYDKDRVLIYADPPYHHDTRTSARYKVDMCNKAQERLIGTLLEIKHAKVLISGYNCSEYMRLTNAGWEKIDIIVNTTGGDRKPKKTTEVLWRNYKLYEKQIDNKLYDYLGEGDATDKVEINPIILGVKKGRGRPRLYDIPSSLKCAKCGQNKKTNSLQFFKSLEKCKLNKEEYITSFICRKCKKDSKNLIYV